MYEMGDTMVKMNCNALAELYHKVIQYGEVSPVGAGPGGGFNHTSELHVMKYKKAINRPNGEAQKKESRTNINE